MNDASTPSSTGPASATNITAKSWATWVGLALSLFSLILIRNAVRRVSPEPGNSLTLIREACMFASAGVLIWIIRRHEKLPLRSIGIGVSPIWKSLLWGVVIAIACVIPAIIIAKLTGYGHGAGSQTLAKLPVLTVFLVVVRAGFVEELFYRGYSISRLKTLGFGGVASWVVPLLVFALAHSTGGFANIGMALVLGSVFTAFFQWRKDLVANIFGHFLLDFVTNVLPAMFS